MLCMEFIGYFVDVLLFFEIVCCFNVNNNIISVQMDYVGGVKFGIMFIEMYGIQEDIQVVIVWLQEYYVKVEVLGYV